MTPLESELLGLALENGCAGRLILRTTISLSQAFKRENDGNYCVGDVGLDLSIGISLSLWYCPGQFFAVRGLINQQREAFKFTAWSVGWGKGVLFS